MPLPVSGPARLPENSPEPPLLLCLPCSHRQGFPPLQTGSFPPSLCPQRARAVSLACLLARARAVRGSIRLYGYAGLTGEAAQMRGQGLMGGICRWEWNGEGLGSPALGLDLGGPGDWRGEAPAEGAGPRPEGRCGSEGMAGGGGEWQEGSQRWGEGRGHRPGGPENAGPGLGWWWGVRAEGWPVSRRHRRVGQFSGQERRRCDLGTPGGNPLTLQRRGTDAARPLPAPPAGGPPLLVREPEGVRDHLPDDAGGQGLGGDAAP